MTSRKLNWDKVALYEFNAAISYISKRSIQNADKVKTDILKKVDGLVMHPETHTIDKYKQNNDGNFRAFELHRYRIAYYISLTEIRILRVRHTSMEPKNY
jgi:plasmid stabilization system protein ParE